MTPGAASGSRRWVPQDGPQQSFVASGVFDLVYGGARGGGKTDAALGDFAAHARDYRAAARGLLVRRTRVALEPTVRRARQIFGPEGAVWAEAKSAFVWPGGAVLSFRHLDSDADADGYQGHSYSRVYVEELTQFPSPIPVDKLKATIRSAEGAPCGFRATCNPGGAGHAWVKARYIDAGPWVVTTERFVDPFTGRATRLTRQFIPARLADNPALIASDPQYVARLGQSGSAELVRAWLEGDWSVIEGAFFDRWSARNVVAPFVVPPEWTRLRAFDWGFAAPFSVGWWALVDDDHRLGDGRVLPRGALVRYREWYGTGRRAGEGPRLTAEEVAVGILERERAAGERPAISVADPSIFAQNGGPSIAERMLRSGARFRPADNTRVGKAGALSGWDQVRARIAGTSGPGGGGGGGASGGGAPMLYVFDTCRDFLRTVPCLQHDPMRPEDLDTAAEDHIADETRYACLARPWFAPARDPRREANERWRREWHGGWRGR